MPMENVRLPTACSDSSPKEAMQEACGDANVCAVHGSAPLVGLSFVLLNLNPTILHKIILVNTALRDFKISSAADISSL